MSAGFELYTLDEVRRHAGEYLAEHDESLAVMSESTWALVKSNPDHPPDFPVAASLRVDDHRVASVALVNQTIQRAGRNYPCLWGHALLSHPKARPLGLGGLFMRQVLKVLRERQIPYAAYGSTPVAVELYESLGMVNAGIAPRYVLPLRSNAFVRHYLSEGTLSKTVTPILNAGLRSWWRYLRSRLRRLSQKHSIRRLERLNECPVLLQLERCDSFHLRRSRELLNWKLDFATSVPGAETDAYSVINDKGNQIGYLLVRIATHEQIGSLGLQKIRMCRVLDLFAARNMCDLAATLELLLDVAARARCEVIELITSNARTRAMCSKLRLRRSGGYVLCLTHDSHLPAEIYDVNSWFLNMIESEPAFY